MRRPPLTLRYPRACLAVALLAVAVLGALGLGVEDELRPTSLRIPGTESARGEALLDHHFGDSAPFAILLRGPAAALDRQGPALIRTLREDPGVSTVSPWDRGSVARLRPSPQRALILADFHVPAERAVRDTVPSLDRTMEETISPPVRATETGFATLSRAIQKESVRSTEVAELVALPFLLAVLLLVFRSPVAAAIPLAFGALTVLASRGVLGIAAPHVAIDGFALTVCTMMGLALGVDYALLIVSRFREELGRGAPPLAAAAATRRTAGRTTAFAGSTLVVAMAVTAIVMPGTLLVSLAGTAIVVAAISVAVAALIAPPLLLMLGPNVDRWRLGGRADGSGLMVAVGAALARPRLAAAAIGALLLLLAAPALAVKTGPPSATQLPESNPARRDAELIDGAIGPGWDAPFLVVAAAERGTITGPGRLAALSRTQRRIAADPGVQAVIGPGQIAGRVEPLRQSGAELLAGRGEASPAELRRLGRRLGDATGGVRQLRSGIAEAAAGAGLLAAGSGRAGEGAGQLAAGLQGAMSGAVRAVEALGQLAGGAGRLLEGQREAALAALSLKFGLTDLLPSLRRNGLARARRLRAALRRAAAGDPSLGAEAREAERLVEALANSRDQVRRLRGTATRLHGGQVALAKGAAKLHRGAARLAGAAQPLPGGLELLGEGASDLAGGLARLTGGADALQHRLAEGARASRPLQSGLRHANVRILGSAARLDRRAARLRRSSPRIFDSGYFVLSALAGSPRGERQRAGRVVDLAHGGQAAQMIVIPRHTFNTPGSAALNRRLRRRATALAASTGLATGVSGGPAQLIDYESAISGRIAIVIAAITLVTFAVLVLVLRALPLAAIAVALNLLTVAVAFGVLTLLFDVPAGWPLGGRTYVDAIGAAGIFGIVFGLSIDYAVFLLTRMRESREGGASNAEAIAFGLERTARVITGAAAIMTAVFVAFAGAPIATVSQLGVGLTVAVLLDATVVRIVLLPALMLLLGERVWWLPRALDRALPKVELHPA